MESTTDQPVPSTGDEPPRSARPLLPLVLIGLTAAVAVAILATSLTGDSDGEADSAATASGEATDSGATASAGPMTLPFTLDDGSQGTLADYEGEPLVVNFFAAWCPPCKAEMPDLEQVHREADGSVRLIGVSHDLDEGTWRGLVEETGVTFTTVFQPQQEIFTSLDLLGMPSTIFVSPEGEIVYRHSGQLNAATLRELIDEHLGVEV